METKSVGAPPFYATPQDLQKAIDDYFTNGYRKVKKVVGSKKDGFREVEIPMVTITDLVIYLGFADRRSFYDYEEREDFSYTIKRARTFIEREYEEMLKENPTGAIFALKNFGWTDKTEQEVYGKGGQPLIDGLSELKNIADAVKNLVDDETPNSKANS